LLTGIKSPGQQGLFFSVFEQADFIPVLSCFDQIPAVIAARGRMIEALHRQIVLSH
jgi:hypothetical protein